MPKAKKVIKKKVKIEEVKIDNQPAVEMTPVPVEDSAVKSMPKVNGVEMTPVPVEESAVKSMPKVNGVEVLAILNDGRETEKCFHCSLANGTTAHVPKSLFK